MPKPTKFDVMRENLLRRHERAKAARVDALLDAQVAQRLEAAAPTVPTVPTMEVHGVLYREAPLPGWHNVCTGCAFWNSARSCMTAQIDAPKVFGGSCDHRRVIYIRA